MEPIVVCALGIVVYGVYLTVKDLIVDFRQEGLLVRPLSSKPLASTSEKGFTGLFITRGLSRSGSGANSPLTYLGCRSELPHFGQQSEVRRLAASAWGKG